MIPRDTEHLDRLRASRSFGASLFMGIIGGALLSTLIMLIISLNTIPDIYGIALISILSGLIIGDVLYGWYFSIKNQRFTQLVRVSVQSENLEGLLKTAIDDENLDPEIREQLKILGAGLKGAFGRRPPNMNDIEILLEQLTGDSSTQPEPPLGPLLDEIHDYIEFMDDISKNTIEILKEKLERSISQVKWGSQLSVEVSSENVILFKKKVRKLFKMTGVEIKFVSHIEKRLDLPLNCILTYSPIFGDDEFHDVLQIVSDSFRKTGRQKDFRSRGVKFNISGEDEFWTTMDRKVVKPICQHVNTLTRQDDQQDVT